MDKIITQYLIVSSSIKTFCRTLANLIKCEYYKTVALSFAFLNNKTSIDNKLHSFN